MSEGVQVCSKGPKEKIYSSQLPFVVPDGVLVIWVNLDPDPRAGFCGFKLHTNTVFPQLLVQLRVSSQLHPTFLALSGHA